MNSVGCYGVAIAPRTDGSTPYATATWYQLCAVQSVKPKADGSDPEFPGGLSAAPFIFFDITNKYSGGFAAEINLGGFRRNLSQIKHSALMAMIVESGSINWMLNGTSASGNASIITTNGEAMGMTCLAGTSWPGKQQRQQRVHKHRVLRWTCGITAHTALCGLQQQWRSVCDHFGGSIYPAIPACGFHRDPGSIDPLARLVIRAALDETDLSYR